MSPLPFPVRIAAGLAATAVEQVRELPRLAAEFPVTAVSQALQASMRVQQKVTELAIKGDKVLGSLRPAPENPPWATFDDDVDDAPLNGHVTTLTVVNEPAPEADEPPAVLPEYPGMTLPQLRGKLRALDLRDLQALLIWETSHDNRPPYVTMLSNRITTVREG